MKDVHVYYDNYANETSVQDYDNIIKLRKSVCMFYANNSTPK